MLLKNAIAYEEGKINSVSLIVNESGSVGILAFDKGVTLETHQVDADVMVQILEGVVEFTADGNPVILKEGEFLRMKPHTPHSLKAVERFKILLTKLNAR